MNQKKGFISTTLIIAVVALFIMAVYFIATQQIILPSHAPIPNPTPAPTPTTTPTPTPTPNPNPNEKQVSLKESQKESSLLVEKIYPDYITGLNFREYPLATNQGSPITLHIGEIASNGCTITLTLISIKGNTATFIEKTDFNRPCPICLAENTLIDTPDGAIPVQNLKKGMPIWTIDEFGNRVSSLIIKTSKTPVPSTHQMVHIILDDKREIFASPLHPIGDGRVMNNLLVDDILDVSRVAIVEKVLYNKGYTYDILPSGSTGLYFANGILIGSTLH